jgi:hypothetical protein
MFTFMPFSPNGCGNLSPILINKFENSSWTIDDRDIFPRKLRNLFQCPLRIATFDYPPSIIVDNKQITGHDVELIYGLSKVLNFKPNITPLMENAAWGFILENGTSTGVMRKVVSNETDIGIGFYYLTLTRAKFMNFVVYTFAQITLVVPRAANLNALEKLYFPFDRLIWTLLTLIFIFGFLIIFLFKNFLVKRNQNFIFEEVSNPYMNMLDVFLNGSQRIFPQKNSAKSLLIGFVLFSMVIRTLYQAGLFKLLQSDQRHAELQNIDELIDKKFDIFMYESFQELSNGLKIKPR